MRWSFGGGVSRAVAFAILQCALIAPTPAAERSNIPSPATNKVDFQRPHWAFKAPVRPPEPKVKNQTWPRNALDRFVLARLEKDNLAPSPEADRVTLIRRLSFDLLGLPPAPKEITEFVEDQETNAYDILVERFLASPQYGERWGRHWLDVAGYADSNGYFDADSDRPLAWKYRDYVVRSFNSDKPFDRFIREQIAGDEMAGYQPDGDITPEVAELLTATHFLRNGPDGTSESDGNPNELRVDRYSVIEGNVQIIGSAMLGLTVQCARCHDHKFEPLTQEQYYQLQAILRPAYDPEKWIKPNDRALTVGPKTERDKNKGELETFEREMKALNESLEGLIKPLRDLVVQENLQTFPDTVRNEIKAALEVKEKKRTDKMKELLKAHQKLVQIKDEDLLKRFPEVAASYQEFKETLQKRADRRPASLPQIAALTEPVSKPPVHHLLVRGNYAKPGREVEPGVPAILCSANNPFQLVAPRTGSSGRRTALGDWLTSPQHPTMARLIVNRIWQHHFGVGLVSTPDNFGLTGSKPSHPELLDWLATEFVNGGWSMKAMHRLMVTSATYRQSSVVAEARKSSSTPSDRAEPPKVFASTPMKALEVDPENRLLWRFSIQRLDAESVRDAMLCITGELDRKTGGPSVPKAKTEEGQYVVNENEPGAKRRSLYLQQKRGSPVTLLDLFDGAKMNPNCVQRAVSTVPLQSLTLLNSEFVRKRSRAFAERLIKEPGADSEQRLALAFRLALGRMPNSSELSAARQFVQSQPTAYTGQAGSEAQIWADFCQMLLASNSFLYVD